GHLESDFEHLNHGTLRCRDRGDHLSSHNFYETGVGRYKQLISPKLSLRDYDAQVGEALAGVKAMNKVIGLGMPIREVLN
ncbi:MAG: IS5/IS1182 family transposase, partial [Shewanella sp.]|nr:IS5/IS1182 family transposase [Shewanella sp.]